MKIKDETINQITTNIKNLLHEYSSEIEESSEVDGTVKISIPVKLEEDGPDINVKVGISFVKTKIVDEINFVISDQKELFKNDE